MARLTPEAQVPITKNLDEFLDQQVLEPDNFQLEDIENFQG